MAENCTHNCETCGENCESRSLVAQTNQYSSIKKVIGVISGKGGVGKSLATALLAVNARRQGLKVAVLDADVTGPSMPRAFGLRKKAEGDGRGILPVETKTGIKMMSINLLLENDTDPVIWRGPIIAGTVKQFWTDVVWGDIDIMFVDMPPGTGDVPLTVFQSLPVDGVVVVSTPQSLVGMIVEKAVNMAGMMNVPVVGLVENMSYALCPDCGKHIEVFGESTADKMAEKLGIARVARVPLNVKLAAACDKGMIELYEGDWLDGITEALIEEE